MIDFTATPRYVTRRLNTYRGRMLQPQFGIDISRECSLTSPARWFPKWPDELPEALILRVDMVHLATLAAPQFPAGFIDGP